MKALFFISLVFINVHLIAEPIKYYYEVEKLEYPASVYWGDTHVHTKLSTDAFVWGNNKYGPQAAYDFASGGVNTTAAAESFSISRPLDFVVVADHAIDMGLMDSLVNQSREELFSTSIGLRWKKMLQNIKSGSEENEKIKVTKTISTQMWQQDLTELTPVLASVWQDSISLADKNYQPGLFTTFIGFEWSPAFNLHRVVIFKGDRLSLNGTPPFTARESSDPEDLWQYMAAYEAKSGGEVIAIPHNSNLSQGVMFALESAKGFPFTEQYARTRMKWEPLIEVTQMKGDSETHPLLSPNDEFADFEKIESSDISSYLDYMRGNGYSDYISWYDRRKTIEKNDDWMRPYEYVRSALKMGLSEHNKTNVNPFKFGMIGSTDSHTSFSTAEEMRFLGKMAGGEPSKKRMTSAWDGTAIDSDLGFWWGAGWRQNASGYAAIWAEENTRESLFAAMKRKEVYASTGPRITVRFFGGWDYTENDAFRPDLARIGYEKGVPMGGDLTAAPKDKAPRFLIRAVKDPDGANLDRVQVIKGWHDANGELHEKIYNVALSDGRKDKGPKTKKVGNTVDIPDASYTNTIGDPELAVVWQDPDFNPNELAFYYLRVLEIPTPRWTAYDAKYFELKNLPEEIPMMTQERAYTSPIWYTPKASLL